ncbi:hypothetical protein [Cupriavidus plantarum]|uniref:hypothetical protein n=1 Tax=Cupriavidus plantarum TaxID=942865 RepID=UPI000EB26221|nr:hypothetical protein [Cupriavidus plantarum]RLK36116.1 hypothetical protein C7417_3892 [Cupriavidus plantarum]
MTLPLQIAEPIAMSGPPRTFRFSGVWVSEEFGAPMLIQLLDADGVARHVTLAELAPIAADVECLDRLQIIMETNLILMGDDGDAWERINAQIDVLTDDLAATRDDDEA